jgi:folylpolyglutamate synthase
MHIFRQLNVSAAILEVGIGGTYDSTNIVPRPLACGISSLGLDHTALLGHSIEEIAAHKAGIYKEAAEAVSVHQKESAMAVVREAAEKAKVRFLLRSYCLSLPLSLSKHGTDPPSSIA